MHKIIGVIHIMIFLFLHKNTYCGYALEAPRRGTSNEYPQYMLLWRNKKNISIFRLKNVPYLELRRYCAPELDSDPVSERWCLTIKVCGRANRNAVCGFLVFSLQMAIEVFALVNNLSHQYGTIYIVATVTFVRFYGKITKSG